METTTSAQAKLAVAVPVWQKVARRTITILIAAVLIGIGMRHASAGLERRSTPAGFFQGLLQGALMPGALPNLVVGNDIVIYAQSNTGVPYKLGYTLGVNVCGAVFFGFFFWRLHRWRKAGKAASEEEGVNRL